MKYTIQKYEVENYTYFSIQNKTLNLYQFNTTYGLRALYKLEKPHIKRVEHVFNS